MTNEEIAIQLANHENRIKVSEHRVSDLEDQQKEIQELTISVKELAISMKNMMEEQREQGERLQKLEEEPGKNWNSVKQTALTTLTSTIAGALAVGIILLLAYYIR
jgi:allophanate hydrolase subunit 1